MCFNDRSEKLAKLANSFRELSGAGEICRWVQVICISMTNGVTVRNSTTRTCSTLSCDSLFLTCDSYLLYPCDSDPKVNSASSSILMYRNIWSRWSLACLV
jgi:hypothetical protein